MAPESSQSDAKDNFDAFSDGFLIHLWANIKSFNFLKVFQVTRIFKLFD